MTEIVPLHLLNAGESGRICDVDGDLPLVSRLGEMGLRSGVTVLMVQPGHPCIVALGEVRLSFRGGEEAVVLVEVQRG